MVFSRIFFFHFLTLQYCIGFAINQHESATGIQVFPILNPPPSQEYFKNRLPEYLRSIKSNELSLLRR